MTALLHAWFGDAAWVAVWLFAIWLAVTLPLALILWRLRYKRTPEEELADREDEARYWRERGEG